ncbi:hypothetical protein IAC76_05445 [Spirochaetes bacterium]|uniref:Uncharacterized protein n=1 Tax=Candidatus Scatousia excrementipullorum TaxID=2840936 RepID=A0A9D9DPA2_9BACT|nr:hypothetical protein [Candidatus Scatousia excrementipullorum]
MKVNPIKSFTFKANNFNEDNTLGYDDEISQSRRNFIREHYDSYRMPYQSIYETEGRLSEYRLNNLINTLTNKPRKVDYSSIISLPVPNIRYIGNNSYRGGTMVDKPECLQALKDAGIKHVISLYYSPEYENAVKQTGLDYHCFNMKHRNEEEGLWYNDVCCSKQSYENSLKSLFGDDKNAIKIRLEAYDRDSRGPIDELVGFVKRMQEGYCYVGCEFGTNTTSDALVYINRAFNPQDGRELEFFDYYKADCLRNLYDKLTVNDKKLMGWTKQFDLNFLPKLEIAKKAFLEKALKEARGLF